MFEKMTDGDVMVYLRNVMLSLSQLSKERNIDISANIEADGYFGVRAGDYTAVKLEEKERERYAYQPIGKIGEFRSLEWQYNIEPQSVRFNFPPKAV